MRRIIRTCLFVFAFFVFLFFLAGAGFAGYMLYGNPAPRSLLGRAQGLIERELGLNNDPPGPAFIDRSNPDLNAILDGSHSADVVIAIDNRAPTHQISPYIYGINWGEEEMIAEINLPIRRMGGNATSRYNWKEGASNRGSDWYFENIPDELPANGTLPADSGMNQGLRYAVEQEFDVIMTLPLIGWVPFDRELRCGFSVEKYGQQQDVDPFNLDCGNGYTQSGKSITVNDPADTSMPVDGEYVTEWVDYLTDLYGPAGLPNSNTTRFYSLDNEPMLWHITHRDVHPAPVTFDELRDLTFTYAATIKAADPTAQTLGPVLWGWEAYFESAHDSATRTTLNAGEDQQTFGNVPFVEWYLQQMQAYEAENGVRLVDYFDLHYYPSQDFVSLSYADDDWTRPLRLRSTRSLWDPNYEDESWIREPVMLIPRMHEWVEENYPGTKLAITEYNFGALHHINGALAQADVLGIFGREQLDMAMLWDPPQLNEPGMYAFKMYRDYDGSGGSFGDQSLQTLSSDQDLVSAYGAVDRDGTITLMLINKAERDVTILPQFVAASEIDRSRADLYRYSPENLSAIELVEGEWWLGSGEELVLPADSINLIVIQP